MMRIPSVRPLAALSALSLTAAGLAVTAPSASADLVTHCVGEAEGVTVPGDLVVPADSTCVLDDVVIDGQARVMAGADLVITGTTINDAVFVNADGYFDAEGSDLGANVTNRAGYGVYLEDSAVGGGFFGRVADGGETTFAYAQNATFQGRVQVGQGEVLLQSTHVSGHVDIDGATYADVLDSTLERTLSVTGTQYGSIVDASEIDGATTVIGSSGAIELGAGDGMNYFGSDVTISDNLGGVDVTGNIIRGDLGGEGNDPAPTGSDNRVRGVTSGQFTDLEPSGTSMSLQRSEQDRDGELQEKRDERRGTALDTAQSIGAADL